MALVGMNEGPLVAPDTDSTVFTITETTGQKRSMRLSGRCLPFSPMTENWEHNAVFTKYPGTSDRTVHTLGFDPKDQDWEGRWDTRYMNGQPLFQMRQGAGAWMNVNTALAAHAFMLDFLQQGQVLEVSYGPSDPCVTVQGLLTRAQFPIHNWWVIEFKLHFEWLSLGSVKVPATRTQPPDTSTWADKATRAMNAVMDGFDGVQAKYDAAVGAPLTMVNNVLGTANAVVAKVDGLYDGLVTDTLRQLASIESQVANLADQVESLAGKPADTARNVAVLAGNIEQMVFDIETNALAVVAQYRDVAVAWQALDPRNIEFLPFLWNADAATCPENADSADQEVVQTQAALSVDLAMRDLLTQCRQLIRSAGQYMTPRLLDVYPVKEGDSLRAVSAHYYNGNPDNWLAIAAANDLKADDLAGVKFLIIPVVT